MDAIKEARREIKEQIYYLEEQPALTPEQEREIAVLIRQDQYLEVLEGKHKSELESIFFIGKKDNCIVPEILQWYKPEEN